MAYRSTRHVRIFTVETRNDPEGDDELIDALRESTTAQYSTCSSRKEAQVQRLVASKGLN